MIPPVLRNPVATAVVAAALLFLALLLGWAWCSFEGTATCLVCAERAAGDVRCAR